jgi:hypothetical protein
MDRIERCSGNDRAGYHGKLRGYMQEHRKHLSAGTLSSGTVSPRIGTTAASPLPCTGSSEPFLTRHVGECRCFSLIDFKYQSFRFLLVIIFIILAHKFVPAQTRTVGVLSMTADTSSGYTLFTPMDGTGTYLVDNFGRLINSWSSDKMAGASVYLLPDGSILRCETLLNTSFNGGGSGGRIKRTSWNGETIWTYDYSSSSHCQHHDCEPLPNGNILIIAWELKSPSEAGAAGRRTTDNVWPDHLVEVGPYGSAGGEIVWEWHVWDHLVQDKDASKANYGVVADHPELVDVNYTVHQNAAGDWMHTNAVEYNEDFDQIMLSVRQFDEVWIIDHSTTTAEAAAHSGGRYGKGGDLLYRFGNPEAHKSGSGSDRILNLHHDARWIPKGRPGAGNVLVFNNGIGTSSSVDEFSLPVDSSGKYDMKKTPAKVWSYAPSGFYVSFLGSSQRLSNGNTLICNGLSGTFYEVDSTKDLVWEYMSPVAPVEIAQQYENLGGGMGMQANMCFHAYRYAPDYAAFGGRNITPSASPLEGGDLVAVQPGKTATVSTSDNAPVSGGFFLSSHTNPLNSRSATMINIGIPQNTDATVKIYSADGREVTTLVNQYLSAGNYGYAWSARGCAGGIYFVRLVTKNYAATERMILLK